jgi:hypothetical protein
VEHPLGNVAQARVGDTCNRDHPQALANYQARGMIVYKIEESRKENIYEKLLFRVRGSAH